MGGCKCVFVEIEWGGLIGCFECFWKGVEEDWLDKEGEESCEDGRFRVIFIKYMNICMKRE